MLKKIKDFFCSSKVNEDDVKSDGNYITYPASMSASKAMEIIEGRETDRKQADRLYKAFVASSKAEKKEVVRSFDRFLDIITNNRSKQESFMSEEFNLTLKDLEEGKKYNVRGSGSIVCINTFGVPFMGDEILQTRKGDRFREVKKEAEFEEVKCYRTADGHLRMSSNLSTLPAMWKYLDYKIENGKLFVRDM